MPPGARAVPAPPTWLEAHTTCGCRPHLSFPRRTQLLQVCLVASRRASRQTGPHLARPGCLCGRAAGPGLGGAETPPLGRGRPPKEALPHDFDCTSTVAGPSVMCLGAVRSGAVGGGCLGGVAQPRCAHWRPWVAKTRARILTARSPARPPPAAPNQTSAAVAILDTTDECG